jgi:hypothetical protein
MTAHHWRTVRLKMLLAGIADPMKLPSMHILLDLVENLVLESFQSTKPEDDKRKREQFQDSLYRPVAQSFKELDEGYKPIPAGFDPEDTEDAFDAAITSFTAGPR